MRERSSDTPPRNGMTWPSNDVPAPTGVTGTSSSPATRRIPETSSVPSA